MITDPSSKTKNCVILCRVSSPKQSQEGESLEVQEKYCKDVAKSRGWQVVPNGKVWSTQISGWKDVRVDFEEMKTFIKAHPGLVDYCLFRSIDRFTRAGIEEYSRMKRELAELGVEMVDTLGIIQPSKNTLEDLGFEYKWSRLSPSEITEAVFSTNSKQEVTNILTRMIGQSIRNTQKGYRTRRPTDGYINQKIYDSDGKKKYIQVPDLQRAKYRIAMFELRAQGLSDPECVERINAMGYISPIQNEWNKNHNKIIGHKGGKPMTVKQFQRDIENTIYAGVLCEKWTKYQPIRAQYPGLVSIETFNRANRGKLAIMEIAEGSLELVRSNPNVKKRKKHNPKFPFNCILCPLCRKSMIGSASTGKGGIPRPAYHCSRGHKRFGVKKREFDAAVIQYITNLKFKPELLNGLELTFMNKYRQREKEVVQASGEIHKTIAELEAEQAAKLEVISTTRSLIVREKFEQEVEALEVKIKSAGKERLKIQISRADIKSFVREAKQIMEHPSEILLQPTDPRAQEALFKLFFEKMPTYADIVSGTPKLSYVFELSSAFAPSKELLVTLQGIEP